MISKADKFLLNTYRRQNLAIVRGRGLYVWDSEGKKYIDCVAGLGVNNVGHCHPKVVKAIEDQVRELMHCSNLYHIPNQIELAELLSEISPCDKAFFANSGAESVEAALKLARKFTKREGIITFLNSFHGRTYGALSATGQEKFLHAFKPLVPGFSYVPYDDLEAVKEEINKKTACVIVEPIQGEGGVILPDEDYLKGLREITNDYDSLLIVDEVQTGFGRTGDMFACMHYHIEPDIMCVAKGLGGGFPIGAIIVKEEFSKGFEPGDHAATFGGNPLACASAIASIRVLMEEKMVENSREVGEYFISKLKKFNEIFKDIRGKGLMIGCELEEECHKYVEFARERGLIINCTADKVLRFLPPLSIQKEEVNIVISILEKIFEDER